MYAGALYNILYSLPMLIWGYIKWKNVQDEKNSGVKVLSKRIRIISSLIILVTTIIYAIILKYLGGNNYILDSITAILGYVAIYLMSNKYIEQWITWIVCNAVSVILWIIITIQNVNNLPMLLMWTIYLINSIYGYVSWNKKYNKDRKN